MEPSATSALSMRQLARTLAPHLRVASISQPEPSLDRYNVLAITGGEEVARAAVLMLEEDESDGLRVGTTVLTRPGDDPAEGGGADGAGVDPEGVTRFVAKRSATGAAIGAVAGALVFGVIFALVTDTTGLVIGAAIGGALFFGVLGATYVSFAGFGGSSAYRQSFVDPEAAAVLIVSFHTDDLGEAHRAQQRLSEHEGVRVTVVDSKGATVR